VYNSKRLALLGLDLDAEDFISNYMNALEARNAKSLSSVGAHLSACGLQPSALTTGLSAAGPDRDVSLSTLNGGTISADEVHFSSSGYPFYQQKDAKGTGRPLSDGSEAGGSSLLLPMFPLTCGRNPDGSDVNSMNGIVVDAPCKLEDEVTVSRRNTTLRTTAEEELRRQQQLLAAQEESKTWGTEDDEDPTADDAADGEWQAPIAQPKAAPSAASGATATAVRPSVKKERVAAPRKKSRRSKTPHGNGGNGRNGKERRSKLPLKSVSMLRQWFSAHVAHPYPTEMEKLQLADEAQLTVKQTTNWFTNTRKRFWQPYVKKKSLAKHVAVSELNHA